MRSYDRDDAGATDAAQGQGDGPNYLSRLLEHGVAVRRHVADRAARSKNPVDQDDERHQRGPEIAGTQKTLPWLKRHYRGAKERARIPEWYEDWSLHTDIYKDGAKRWVFVLPHVTNDHNVVIVQGRENSRMEGLVDLLDSALTALCPAANRQTCYGEAIKDHDAAE